eukprot:Colp12_sorted_trinity150504_noHs@17795
MLVKNAEEEGDDLRAGLGLGERGVEGSVHKLNATIVSCAPVLAASVVEDHHSRLAVVHNLAVVVGCASNDSVPDLDEGDLSVKDKGSGTVANDGTDVEGRNVLILAEALWALVLEERGTILIRDRDLGVLVVRLRITSHHTVSKVLVVVGDLRFWDLIVEGMLIMDREGKRASLVVSSRDRVDHGLAIAEGELVLVLSRRHAVEGCMAIIQRELIIVVISCGDGEFGLATSKLKRCLVTRCKPVGEGRSLDLLVSAGPEVVNELDLEVHTRGGVDLLIESDRVSKTLNDRGVLLELVCEELRVVTTTLKADAAAEVNVGVGNIATAPEATRALVVVTDRTLSPDSRLSVSTNTNTAVAALDYATIVNLHNSVRGSKEELLVGGVHTKVVRDGSAHGLESCTADGAGTPESFVTPCLSSFTVCLVELAATSKNGRDQKAQKCQGFYVQHFVKKADSQHKADPHVLCVD